MSYALRLFAHQGEDPPFEWDRTRVLPAKAKTEYGVSANGTLVHRVDALAVMYAGGSARFGARWMCGAGSDKAVLLKEARPDELCAICITARQPVVYRCYDAFGELLYIGCTENLNQRIRGHENTSPWWFSVADIRLEHFTSAMDARRAERAAIRSEHPKFNRAHRTKAAS